MLNNYASFAVSLVGFWATIVGCSLKPESTYRVALLSLPERMSPRKPVANTDSFINQHVYFPLFYRDDQSRIASHFLDLSETKAISSDFLRFQLCLKNQVRFSDQTFILPDDLSESLRASHHINSELAPLKELKTIGKCLLVAFSKPDPFYFEKLSGIDSTILKKSTTREAIPIGLGPYKVAELSRSKIVLKAVPNYVEGNISTVEFLAVEGDPNLVKVDVHDWNHLYHVNVPERLLGKTQIINRPLWKVYSVLVKLRSPEMRRQFSECFNATEFISALGLSLNKTPGHLPIGMSGSAVAFAEVKNKWPSANCASKKKLDVRFVSYNPQLHDPIVSYFERHPVLGGVKLHVKKMTLADTIRLAYSNSELITIVGTDAHEPTLRSFLNGLIGQDKFVFADMNLEKLIASSQPLEGINNRENTYRAIHHAILNSGYIVPLGQLKAKHRYRDNILGIRLTNLIHGFTQIDKMRRL